jgi:hypothetical protein
VQIRALRSEPHKSLYISLKSILLLSTRLSLSIPSDFPTKTSRVFRLPHACYMTAYVALLNLIALITFDKYKLQSCSLLSFLKPQINTCVTVHMHHIRQSRAQDMFVCLFSFFLSLEVRQLLEPFASAYYWRKIKPDCLTKTGTLYIYKKVHEAGQITKSRINSTKITTGKDVQEPDSGVRIKTAMLLRRNGVSVELNLPHCTRALLCKCSQKTRDSKANGNSVFTSPQGTS